MLLQREGSHERGFSSRRESLHYGVTALPLLIASVRRLYPHLRGVTHRILHAVMQSHR